MKLEPTHWLDIRDKETLEVPADHVSYGDIKHKKDLYHIVPLAEISYATGSDYSGGLVTRSNYLVIEQMAEEDEDLADFLVFTYGGYGTYGVFIRLDLDDEVPDELIDVVSALSDYPLLDDDHHSNLEIEAEDEAWSDWGRSDFHRALEKSHLALDHEEIIEDLTDDQLDELWRIGADQHGDGGVIHEETGPYFYVDSVAKILDEEDLLKVQKERMSKNPYTGPGVGPKGREHVHHYECNPLTGMTTKGKRMYKGVKASGSAYAPSAVVYGAAKHGQKGLVTKKWAKEHGYPKPNPKRPTEAYRREEMKRIEEEYGLDPYFPTDPMDAREYLAWLKSGETYFEGFDE